MAYGEELRLHGNPHAGEPLLLRACEGTVVRGEAGVQELLPPEQVAHGVDGVQLVLLVRRVLELELAHAPTPSSVLSSAASSPPHA